MALQFTMQTKPLKPVSAYITSYGRSSRIDKATTLYVIRVTKGQRSWYVARRYSEFRSLHTQLKVLLATQTCSSCEQLADTYDNVEFPQRFRVRSGIPSAREKIEESRVEQLNTYMQILMGTTQGLLGENEGWESGDHVDEDGVCKALTLVNKFLLVDEQEANDDTSTEDTSVSSHDSRRRSLKKLDSFQVSELDLLYREPSHRSSESFRSSRGSSYSSPQRSMRWSGRTTKSPESLPYAEIFDDLELPPLDAIVQR